MVGNCRSDVWGDDTRLAGLVDAGPRNEVEVVYLCIPYRAEQRLTVGHAPNLVHSVYAVIEPRTCLPRGAASFMAQNNMGFRRKDRAEHNLRSTYVQRTRPPFL